MFTIKTTGQKIESYSEAIKIAKSINSDVVCDRGLTRWSPLPPVSEKKMRQYRERMNAYNASQKDRS